MGSKSRARPCLICRKHETKSNSGFCYRCRPCPRVHVDGDSIYIGGIGPMTHDTALRLAHAICDALTP